MDFYSVPLDGLSDFIEPRNQDHPGRFVAVHYVRPFQQAPRKMAYRFGAGVDAVQVAPSSRILCRGWQHDYGGRFHHGHELIRQRHGALEIEHDAPPIAAGEVVETLRVIFPAFDLDNHVALLLGLPLGFDRHRYWKSIVAFRRVRRSLLKRHAVTLRQHFQPSRNATRECVSLTIVGEDHACSVVCQDRDISINSGILLTFAAWEAASRYRQTLPSENTLSHYRVGKRASASLTPIVKGPVLGDERQRRFRLWHVIRVLCVIVH